MERNVNLKFLNIINIGAKDIGSFPYKNSKIVCPYMPPYQAPKGRLKFPMSLSP